MYGIIHGTGCCILQYCIVSIAYRIYILKDDSFVAKCVIVISTIYFQYRFLV